jgi:predicted DNA binding CopG/RHH family protein
VVIRFPDGDGYRYRAGDDRKRETSIPKMERPMKKSKLPQTDSIQELAEFWDTHDLTDFEDELEEVAEPIFVRGTAIKVPLESGEVEAVEQMAQVKGVSREELIRAWVLQKLTRRNKSRPTKR